MVYLVYWECEHEIVISEMRIYKAYDKSIRWKTSHYPFLELSSQVKYIKTLKGIFTIHSYKVETINAVKVSPASHENSIVIQSSSAHRRSSLPRTTIRARKRTTTREVCLHAYLDLRQLPFLV